MKGTLEFNLDDSADMQAYLRAVKSTKLAITLWEMDQYLRSQTNMLLIQCPRKYISLYNRLEISYMR